MDDVFGALGDATRRRILEILAAGEQPAGAVVEELQTEGRISQPAVSQHLKVLRDAGLVAVRTDGARRMYRVDPAGIEGAHAWLLRVNDPLAAFEQPLDAIATEVARGRRQRRAEPEPDRRAV